MAVNLVELATAGDDDCAFDQPCKFGHRVEGHAVYCHNDAWPDGPRKCRRTWYTGGETKDEDCPGFQPNPEFKGALNPTPIAGERCSKCDGAKLIKGDKETVETCPRCMGDGAEPKAMPLSQFEQDTLESATVIAKHHGERFNRIAENDTERDGIEKLSGDGLIVIRSVSWTGEATVYLLETTDKGQAVMRANWAARKERNQ